MMTGHIKYFLPQKKFGFIKGADGKDYFFHESSLVTPSQSSNIIEDALVEFDPDVTPKGYRARRVIIKSTADVDTYVIPDEMITSKQENIPGWEIIEQSDWIITASNKSLDIAKGSFKGMAEIIGANGIISVEYRKTTGYEGNYKFSEHNYTGRPVVLGKRSLSGQHSKNDLIGINVKAQEIKKDCEEKNEAAKGKRWADKENRIWLGVAISIAVTLITGGHGWWAVPFIMVLFIFAPITKPEPHGAWLRHSIIDPDTQKNIDKAPG